MGKPVPTLPPPSSKPPPGPPIDIGGCGLPGCGSRSSGLGAGLPSGPIVGLLFGSNLGNGLAVGNSFVSGGVKGIDGPTGKAETISSACGRPVSYLGMGKPTGLPITPVSLSKVCGGGGKATGPPCINPAPPLEGS